MKTTMNYLRISFFVLALFMGSCSKEVTEDPKGALGKNRTVGTTGTDSIQGEPGKGGNANASKWLPIELATTTPTYASSFTISAPEIGGNMSIALVMVYGRHTSNNDIIALPFAYLKESYRFVVLCGEILLLAETIDATANATFQLFDQIKYVLIQSNNTSKSSKDATLSHLKQAGVDINDYRQVRDYYALDY